MDAIHSTVFYSDQHLNSLFQTNRIYDQWWILHQQLNLNFEFYKNPLTFDVFTYNLLHLFRKRLIIPYQFHLFFPCKCKNQSKNVKCIKKNQWYALADSEIFFCPKSLFLGQKPNDFTKKDQNVWSINHSEIVS